MAGRKAPRPLPRPVRWLAMFLALVFVVSLRKYRGEQHQYAR